MKDFDIDLYFNLVTGDIQKQLDNLDVIYKGLRSFMKTHEDDERNNDPKGYLEYLDILGEDDSPQTFDNFMKMVFINYGYQKGLKDANKQGEFDEE